MACFIDRQEFEYLHKEPIPFLAATPATTTSLRFGSPVSSSLCQY
jgi:hypothetical protein